MPQSIVDQVLQLRTRLLATGFGHIKIPAGRPHDGDAATGEIAVRPNPIERDDLLAFIERLIREYDYDRQCDALTLSYENGKLTHARITFTARPC